MALQVTTAQPNQTISGVTQAPTQTLSGVVSSPTAGATNYNPQQTATTTAVQPTSTTPIQGTSPTLQGTTPTLQPATNPQNLDPNATINTGQGVAPATAVPTGLSLGTPPSPSETAFNQVKNTPAPQDSSSGTSAATTATNQNTPIDQSKQISLVQNTLANDPGYQKLLADSKEFSSSANQKESLVSQYQDLLKQYNIPGIDSELLNDKKIIDGTEDDIRHEVQAAGGFATDSQVLGLATARNKTLIGNYNNLVAQKGELMSQINTMSGLQAQDRAFAQQTAMQQLQIDQQLNDYAQKFQNNAKEAYTNVISAVGYAGLYKALQNDPASLSLAEQTLGFGPGSLAGLASIADPNAQLKAVQLAQAQFNLQQDQTNAPLDTAAKQAQIAASKASTANTYSEIANRNATTAVPNSPGYDASGKKYTVPSASAEINALWKSGYVQGNGTISSSDYKQEKAWWTSQGLPASDFDSQFSYLADKSGTNWAFDYGLTNTSK